MVIVITVCIICAILLILVVLAQNSKGGGLTEQFGGSSSSQLIGVKRTGDLLEKVTWGLALLIMVLAVGSKAMMSDATSINEEVDDTVEITAPIAQPQAQPAPATPQGDNVPEGLTGGEKSE